MQLLVDAFPSNLVIFAFLLGFVAPVIAIVDLFDRTDERVAGGSRVPWALSVLFLPLAWVVYFVAGRRER